MLQTNNPFIGLIASIDSYSAARAINELATDRVREIRRRIQQLAAAYDSLMRLNARLVQLSDFRSWFDPLSESVHFYAKGKVLSMKLNRADPDVPIRPDGGAVAFAYRVDLSSSEQDVLLLELEFGLEGFYSNAWRIIGLVRQLPGHKSFDCPEVRDVRNWLSEHPERRQHAILTFGFGSEGPKIHAMRAPGDKEDMGLVNNAVKFAGKLINVFGNSLALAGK